MNFADANVSPTLMVSTNIIIEQFKFVFVSPMIPSANLWTSVDPAKDPLLSDSRNRSDSGSLRPLRPSPGAGVDPHRAHRMLPPPFAVAVFASGDPRSQLSQLSRI